MIDRPKELRMRLVETYDGSFPRIEVTANFASSVSLDDMDEGPIYFGADELSTDLTIEEARAIGESLVEWAAYFESLK